MTDAAGEMPDLQQELDGLVAANRAGLADLARQGAQVDPAALLSLRIDILAQLVLSEPGMLQFRLRFERQVAEALEEIRGQVSKARLAQAGQFSPARVREMARAQGLLGPDGSLLRR